MIITSNPIDQVEFGTIQTPSAEQGAAGDSRLDVPQRSISIGEPVPIVFARRRNSKGGVLISPGATEARFENDTNNAVTAYYHLVLSDGEIDKIPVKDVFQRSCRVGTHIQTYNRRAGTWDAGNAIVARAGYTKPEAPYYCGTIGSYAGMSTMSFQTGLIPDGFDYWNRQVHAFIRGGMRVLRYEDDVVGPSDSLADLYRWMLAKTSRIPDDLLDHDTLEATDRFLRVNGLTCNTWITESTNLSDLIGKWGPYFLVIPSGNYGKKGLRPILPTTSAGALITTPITPAYAFTEASILPDSFQVTYASIADRQPFVAQMIWRQQLEDDIGIIRTLNVRLASTAADGPYESHDLSAFCTNEDHAAKVGAYIVSKRVYSTHTISFSVKPGAHNTLLVPGDIIRVRLRRVAASATLGYHDFLYQIERISKTLTGDIGYECSHFPVDDLGRSVIARAVANVTGTGLLMTSNRSGISCDTNSSSDNTLPPDTGTDVDETTNDNPYGTPVTVPPGSGVVTKPGDGLSDGGNASDGSLNSGGNGSGGGNGGTGNGDPNVPGDPIDPYNPDDGTGKDGPEVGDELTPDTELGDGCSITVVWYTVDPDTGQITVRKRETVSSGGDINNTSYPVAPEDEGQQIHVTYIKICPDDEEPQVVDENLGTVQPIATPPFQTKYVRWNGSFSSDDARANGSYATKWFTLGSDEYMTVYGTLTNVSYIQSSKQGSKWQSNAWVYFTGEISPSCFSGTPCSVRKFRSGYPIATDTSLLPRVGLCYPDQGLRIAVAEGQWEFSNDKTNIEGSWKGVTVNPPRI